jgi:uncharacterized coiled-coil protein SlyX
MKQTQELLLDTLMKLDKDIAQTEKDIEFMQKQLGKKLQKLSDLKQKRRMHSGALQELKEAVQDV